MIQVFILAIAKLVFELWSLLNVLERRVLTEWLIFLGFLCFGLNLLLLAFLFLFLSLNFLLNNVIVTTIKVICLVGLNYSTNHCLGNSTLTDYKWASW